MLYIPYPFKRCTKCGEEFPETAMYFYKQPTCKNGLRPDCKKCFANATRIRYMDNPEEYRKRTNARNAANPEKNRARVKKWRKTNPDKKKEQSRREYTKNREKIKARARVAYYTYPERHKKAYQRDRLLHPERRKESSKRWQQNNVDKVRIKGHRHRAKMRMLPFDFTIAEWDRCLEYFNHRCAVCNRPRGLWHTLAQDHWIPVTQGGCNNSKNNRNAAEWLRDKYGARKAKQILKKINDYFAWVKAQDFHEEDLLAT